MKVTYSDYFADNPNFSKYSGHSDAIVIFDILSKSIIGMNDASEARKPVLSACVDEMGFFLLTEPIRC